MPPKACILTVQYRQDIIRLLQWVFGPIKVKLGSICDLERGKRVVKSQLSLTNGYPVFQNSLTPLGYFERNNRQAKNTFIVCAGAAGEVGFSKIPFWAADDIFTIDNSENIVSKYIYYVLLHQQHKLKSKVRMASIPRLSRSSIENIQFILPNIKVQTEIVNNLDKFNTICSDLSEGLPKEIELRQKQYEYYRDKQLTFD
ncbi:restriction endonuclease subunit S [Streptococcus dysgalactiae]|uniref:restriction endonuclease subunit S n=1 Tax=Streptococcus dysgalactiae TaxID=1334 RepID=UPI003FD7BAFA